MIFYRVDYLQHVVHIGVIIWFEIRSKVFNYFMFGSWDKVLLYRRYCINNAMFK